MNGMAYKTFQYYSYKDLKSLQDILKIDSIGFVNIDEDEQIIEYEIDRSKCLKLSDLILMINQGFFEIYLGQLLGLFLDLLRKVISLKNQHSIDHQYLDENRIWLVFQDSNKCINFDYQKIEYKIVFTGYQCQLYEESSEIKIPAEQKVQRIIKDILINFKNKNTFINSSEKDKIIKFIYDPIIQECDKMNIQNTLNLILEILNKFKFNSEEQTIAIDQAKIKIDKTNLYFVQNSFKDFIENLKGESSFILETFLFFQLKSFTNMLDRKVSGFLKAGKKEIEKGLQMMKQFYEKYQCSFEKNIQSIIQTQFENILKQQLENYKFEISEEEKLELITSISNRILNMKLNKYVYNSPHYFIKADTKQILEYQINLFSTLSESIIKEEVELLIDLKILQLINELI
ncbi:unnamed protein product (macronuclear) [Paramecium tetraurelia]|uniref:Uncharacterized protein n=1 Tax=Paramecium tetraurelia TaxID=5888 RepID=A0BJF9_PARTE|nr:uncharacterized protein GSPATT00029303001 [Paramecium tetraurelia]CAK58676.1 unnamed protein product [Paramecium tetraurelia]|eukprot:XP_001426074.1 hypothetical protein (macronuclear) [Paramecium tetraurelia strain d4-2]